MFARFAAALEIAPMDPQEILPRFRHGRNVDASDYSDVRRGVGVHWARNGMHS